MITCEDRAGQVQLTSRLVGLKTSILDIERLYGKPGPILLEFLRLGTLANARSGKSADVPSRLHRELR